MLDKVTAVIADVDGTLNVKGGMPGPRTIAAMERLHEMGILFGTASGRPIDHRSLDNAKKWGLSFEFDLAIGMNGGDVWDKDHEGVEHRMLLEAPYVRQICEYMWQFDCNVIVYEDAYDHVLGKRFDEKFESSIVRNNSFWELTTPDVMGAQPTGKIEIQYDEALDDEILGAVARFSSPNWSAVRTFPGTVEFMRPGVDKGVGLRRYAERNGIAIDQIMAFGDMDNDIAMLEAAGWGVCMANGCDAAKAVANDVTTHGVLEDGFGIYLEENFFGPRA